METGLDVLLEVVLIGLALVAIGFNSWLYFRGNPAWRLTRVGNVVSVSAGLSIYLLRFKIMPGSIEHIVTGRLIIIVLLAAITGNALGRIIGVKNHAD